MIVVPRSMSYSAMQKQYDRRFSTVRSVQTDTAIASLFLRSVTKHDIAETARNRSSGRWYRW